MANVIFRYGAQSVYDNLVETSQTQDNALYFITDTQRIYKGTQLMADVSNVIFTDTQPQFGTASSNILYVYTDSASGTTTILVKGTDSMVTVGGGEIADGSITFSKLNTDAVTTSSELTSGALPDSDTTLPTAAAVKDAIETAIQGVTDDITALGDPVTGASAQRNETNNGTVITLTRASGTNPITVNVSDLFLTSAEYDSASHTLKLYVQGVSVPVEVDLTQLIPTTSTFSTVEVGSGNGFEVNLGSGVGLGGFSAGDEITDDMTLAEFAKKLLMKQVPPTYTDPTVSISRNGGTANGNVEIGTNVNVSLRSTFTQNDAGALTSIQFKKGSENVGEPSSTSPASYTETINSFDTSVSYTAVASYGQGPVKDDNLGDPYPTGQIPAGSKTSSTISFNPYRKGFYGAVSSKDSVIDSAFVRSLPSSTTSAPAQGNTWTISIPVGTLRVAFAYPATLRDVNSVKDVNGLNAEIKSAFTMSTVSVEGANGYAGTNYKVYVTDFATPTDAANSYTVQI